MRNRRNFQYLLASNLISTFVGSIIGPFYILFVKDLGGTPENFGISFGLMAISMCLTSYTIGKYSDRLGRKPFLVFSNLMNSFVILLYLFVGAAWQLFILQVTFGIINSMWRISETTFLADITKKSSRGSMIGMYNAISGLLEGFALIISGFIVAKFGLSVMFYITSGTTAVATIPLLMIKE